MSSPTTLESLGKKATSIKEAAQKYERDGFCMAEPILSKDLIDRTVGRMDAVMRGEYETGKAPLDSWWSPGDPPTKLRKIDGRGGFDGYTDQSAVPRQGTVRMTAQVLRAMTEAIPPSPFLKIDA